jgi:hypothetical protein
MRSRRLAVLACACLAPFGWLLFWAVFHTVPGQDWVVFHTAAARFFANDLAMLADPRAFTDELNRSHAAWFTHPISVLHPFIYPPVTLLLAIAFGWLPYLWSFAAFLAATLGLLAAALWPWQSRPVERAWLICGVLACPATAYTIGSGQLSFLVAAAVLAGTAWLDRRPFLAGATFSLLCLKPQFVPLIPVALLAGRHWRAVAGGLAGGLALMLASAVVVGTGAWVAWLDLLTGRNPLLGSLIDVVRVYDQSVHTCMHILGFNDAASGAGQTVATLLSAACIAVVFARRAPIRQRLLVLLCALVFGAPHVGDYDHVLVAIAAVMLMIDGRFVWLAAAAWIATAFNPPALIAVLGQPVLTDLSAMTPLLVGALMVCVTRRGRQGLLF